MEAEIKIDCLDFNDKDKINTIANWYFDEWSTPKEKTFNRLESQPNDDVLVQVIATKQNQLLGTAGLANQVNLIKVHERFKFYKPWVALIYTDKLYRRQGIGKLMLEEIEKHAKKNNLKEIYLYSFTAESLYIKCGWKTIDRVSYKEHNTAIMKKEF